MKRILSFLLLNCIGLSAVFGQQSFKKHYSVPAGYVEFPGYDDFPDNIVQTTDNGYIMCGYYDDGIANIIGFILKINDKGNKEWEKFYYGVKFDHIVETKDFGILAYGSDTEHSLGPGGSIIKLNKFGDELWSKFLPDFRRGSSIDVNQVNEDFVFSCSGGGIRLVCMDSVGNVRWAKSGLGKVSPTSDGGYAVLSNQNLIRYNANGDRIWTKNYSLPGEFVEHTYDGGFILAGGGGLLIKTDTAGDTLWTRSLIHPSGIGSIYDVVQLMDSSFIVTYFSTAASYEFGYSSISNSGDLLWSREIQPYSTEWMRPPNSIKTDDNGFVLLTNEKVYPEFTGGTILKFNSDGLICGEPPIDLAVSIGSAAITVGVGDTLAIDSITTMNYTPLEAVLSFTSISQFQIVTPPICLISVDSTSTQNKVVWEKPVTAAIDSFMIYREFGSGSYGIVGSVPYDSLSQFYDNTVGVNPNITSYRYKISAIDTCGNESQLSDYHETMHLTTNVGISGEVNLIWDAYEGFSFSYYRILRDSTFSGDWELLDSVTSSNFTYSDNNPPSIGAAYMIEVVAPGTCTSTKAVNHNSSRSNKGTISGGSATLAPESAFLASTTQINAGQTVDFLDQSANDPSGWTWLFEGGTPAFSLAQHPVGITYDTPGMYDVTLIAANALGRDTLVKTDYIEVLPATSIQELVEQSVTLYPNPTNDRVTIELSELALPCYLEIKDINGRLIRSERLTDTRSSADLSGLEGSVYLFRLYNSDFTHTAKVVKQ